MPDLPSLDRIYTTDEAAERLRLTRRAVIKLGRNLGACSRFGRDVYLFSESDILAIWQAMRHEPAVRLERATAASISPADLAYASLPRRVEENSRRKRRER